MQAASKKFSLLQAGKGCGAGAQSPIRRLFTALSVRLLYVYGGFCHCPCRSRFPARQEVAARRLTKIEAVAPVLGGVPRPKGTPGL